MAGDPFGKPLEDHNEERLVTALASLDQMAFGRVLSRVGYVRAANSASAQRPRTADEQREFALGWNARVDAAKARQEEIVNASLDAKVAEIAAREANDGR